MASTYLTFTPSSTTNNKVWTWSGWIKRSTTSTSGDLFMGHASADAGSDNGTRITLLSGNAFRFFNDLNGQATEANLTTTALFRDMSAWYHFVVAVDTTQSTASNRVKMYVNGEQITDFSTSTYPSQNDITRMSSTNTMAIGRRDHFNDAYFDGYMAHVHFCDGTQYAASDFGETDTNGQWKPKTTPSVTYGTNGFFLKFANSGSLGTDSSGNGNNFTQSGSGDQVTDTPDNVFATWNSIDLGGVTLSEGNLKAVVGTSASRSTTSTIGVSSGKWYCEAKMGTLTAAMFGVVGEGFSSENSSSTKPFSYSDGVLYYSSSGNAYIDSTSTSYGATYTTNDIIGIALNLDDDEITFYKNGSSQGTITSKTFTGHYRIVCSHGSSSDSSTLELNTGNPTFTITSGNTDDNGYGNFEYAPPTGYLALCTKNLASQLTLPIGDGSLYQNQVLYTGDGNNSRTVTGTGFQPDWVWVKVRNTGYGHKIFDSSRGAGKRLSSNSDGAEATVTDELTSFDSDGFTTNNNAGMNENTRPFVAWQWKANGGTTSTNTDGTVSCTIQTNSTSKFSIFTYSGTSSVSSTVGHGLGTTPAMIIVKNITDTGPWWTVWHQDAGETSSNLPLNSDTAPWTPGGGGYITSVGSSTWGCSDFVTAGGVGDNIMGSGKNYIGYAFAEVEGYSKFGSYTGNGSLDGPFIYTGFRPAFVIKKRSDGLGNWHTEDSTRNTYNVCNLTLLPNTAGAEDSSASYDIDILSNGFKIRATNGYTNASGGKYIYIAFAENPFVDSTGRPATAR